MEKAFKILSFGLFGLLFLTTSGCWSDTTDLPDPLSSKIWKYKTSDMKYNENCDVDTTISIWFSSNSPDEGGLIIKKYNSNDSYKLDSILFCEYHYTVADTKNNTYDCILTICNDDGTKERIPFELCSEVSLTFRDFIQNKKYIFLYSGEEYHWYEEPYNWWE